MTLAVINQWAISDVIGYGPAQTTVANTTGNALVAIVAAGADFNNNGLNGYVPRMTLSDDSHNMWQFAGSNYLASPGASRRVDVWVCPNAMAAKTVNVASNILYAGIGGTVMEVTGFPQWVNVDFVTGQNGSGTTWSLSGTATVSDFVLGASVYFGGLSGALTTGVTGALQLTVQNTGTGLTDMSQIQTAPFYFTSPQAAGLGTYTQTWTNSVNWSAVIVGFKASPVAPATQPNINWPGVKVEAAFGWLPGTLNGAMPVWTDISSRANGNTGETVMDAVRGRDYELTQPEAGTLQLQLNNKDGAFNPQETSSPYYGNVLPEVPVRLSAVWNGRQYGLGYYYANKWTQDFPTPQYGYVTLEASDAIGMASQGTMPTAYAGQVLADFAYAYWPHGEFYTGGAHGSLFANQSRVSQKPMVGYSPPGLAAGVQLQTGQSISLAGDPATGIGITGAGSTSFTGISGTMVRDYGLPVLAAGVSLELWTLTPSQLATSGNVLTALGVPSNYYIGTGGGSFPNGARLTIIQQAQTTTTNIWQFQLIDPTGAFIVNTTTSAQATKVGALNHVVVTVSLSGSTWSVALYINGAQVGSTSTGTSSATLDWSVLATGGVIPTGGETFVNDFTLNQVAVYPWVLPAKRIKEHYNTGNTANSGDTLALRLGKLFQWSGLSNLPFGSTPSAPTPFIGNADQIAGTALSDALYNLTIDEGGMVYAPATMNGEIWYQTRTSLYNQASMATFGDNGTSEIPYDAGAGFDFSDQYLFNIVSSQRTINAGSNTTSGGLGIQQQSNSLGADAVAADTNSEIQYFSRGPLQQDIETTSDADAYDRANWSLNKYRQPQLRANQIKVDCASNPSAFATMLSVEQGDVVTVNRRPVGYAQTISLQCIVQKVEHSTGPNMWDVTLTLAPATPESNVLQLDAAGFNVVGNNVLAW